MTAAATIEAAGRRWRFLPETAPALSARFQAIARAQLIDELTDLPSAAPLTVTTETIGLWAKATPGGVVGLSGRPAALYPDPWPAVAPRVAMHIAATGFLPVDLAGDLPAQASFPDDFTLLDFGTVALHRAPTTISGQVVSRATGPIGGANVEVIDIWPSMDAIVAAGDPPDGLSVWAGLYADRPIGATVRRRTLTLQPGPKRLLRPADAGATELRLSDRLSLALGDPVAIETADPERAEYVAVATIDTASSPDQPALVTLAHPLRRAHSQGAEVLATAPAVAGLANPISRAARAGDAALFTAGLAGFAPADLTLEVTGGGPDAEYHRLALWQATTSAEGRYRLPPLHRLAHLRLRATGGGLAQPIEVIASLVAPGELVVDLQGP